MSLIAAAGPALVASLLAAVLIGVVVVAVVWRSRLMHRGPATAEPSFYQIAYLAGGPRRVAETALAYLVWAGVIEVRERTRKLVLLAVPRRDQPLEPVERAIVSLVETQGSGVTLPMAAATDAGAAVADEMPGLAVSPADWRRILGAVAAGGLGIVAVVAVWTWARLSADRSLGLVPAVGLAALAVVLVTMTDRPYATLAGDEAVARMREQLDTDLEVAVGGVTSVPIERAMYLVALYGRPVMTGGLSPVRQVLTGR